MFQLILELYLESYLQQKATEINYQAGFDLAWKCLFWILNKYIRPKIHETYLRPLIQYFID